MHMQACDVNLDGEVSQIMQAAPYIIQMGIAGTEKAQFFVACEKEVLLESKNLQDVIIYFYAAYYTFDISYPKGALGLFLFFQHYIFNMKDAQSLPACAFRLASCLCKIPM